MKRYTRILISTLLMAVILFAVLAACNLLDTESHKTNSPSALAAPTVSAN